MGLQSSIIPERNGAKSLSYDMISKYSLLLHWLQSPPIPLSHPSTEPLFRLSAKVPFTNCFTTQIDGHAVPGIQSPTSHMANYLDHNMNTFVCLWWWCRRPDNASQQTIWDIDPSMRIDGGRLRPPALHPHSHISQQQATTQHLVTRKGRKKPCKLLIFCSRRMTH